MAIQVEASRARLDSETYITAGFRIWGSGFRVWKTGPVCSWVLRFRGFSVSNFGLTLQQTRHGQLTG